MKSLAEFIMRGRLQAMLMAAAFTASLLLAWVGAAVVALVVLRLGLNAAGGVILAAMVPAAGWAVSAGDIGPATTIFCVVALAVILRQTMAWSAVLFAVPIIVSGWCYALLVMAPDYIAQVLEPLQQMTEQLFANMNEQRAAGGGQNGNGEPLEAVQAPLITAQWMMGMFGMMQVMTALLSLMLARWWQAMLYNPGGFRQEFHQLRLEKPQVVVLVAGLVLLSLNDTWSVWSWMFAVPLCLAGIALVHGLAGQYNISRQWLVLFYVLLVLLAPMTPFLMMMAIADSAMDFRERARQRIESRDKSDDGR